MTKMQFARTLAFSLAAASRGQTVYWNFDSETPAAVSAANVAASAITRGNCGAGVFLTNSSPSDVYASASGGSNALATAGAGPLTTNLSAYLQFTLTPDADHVLKVTRLTFGTRSTATGPQAYGLRCDLNGYAAAWANGVLSANSTWSLVDAVAAIQSSIAGQPVTFRIYGYGGAGGGTSNWRVDDLTVWASAVAPGTPSPPVIFAAEPQSVRVGETLSLALNIAATDGDPVTATNVSAEAGVSGTWSFAGGLLRYAPSSGDLGERAFTFTASDKDGTSLPAHVSVTVRKTQVAAIRLAEATGAYAQTFDGLATNAAGVVWDNAADPLEAWYAYADGEPVTTYRTGAGSGTSSGLYSFGAATNADRSLGSLAGNELAYRYGVAFTNATGQAITNLLVRFTAEQWRAASAATSTLAFAYCVTDAVLPFTAGIWHPVQALCFESPAVTNALQASGPVYLSRALCAAITRPVAPGRVVMLRWSDGDDAGNDPAFGIDDVRVAWSCGPLLCGVPVSSEGAHEHFDEMGTNAPAELPYHWRIETRGGASRASGAYAAAAGTAAFANAAGVPSGAGSYAFSSCGAYDQAVGGLLASNGARTVTVSARFANALGAPLRRWTVRYALEKYRNGTSGSAVRLLSSLDGETWAEVGEPSAFAADANADGYAPEFRPGTSVAVERQVAFGAPIAPGATFYLAWQFSPDGNAAAANCQALALDDVDVLPSFDRRNLLLIK